ncbi:MAG: TMEM165/GDT1 family protein [Bacillota bacterium]|nr:TMEM165/GDT1 family protein [Bacillota bacterium]
MGEIIKALLFVVVAEMGDKTQLLAMAMASKYKVREVMMGVLAATILNHALAVALGGYLGSVIPMNAIKIAAGVSFLVFGLWTLRGDKIDDEEDKKFKFGPVVTVAIAFFIAEMGDKTQLMTITIAADGGKPMLTLIGSTCGMLVADGIGIIGGAWLCKHVPERYIKWGAGVVFMFFGTLSLYIALPSSMINLITIAAYFAATAGLIYLFGIKLTYKEQACSIVLKKEDVAADINTEGRESYNQ